MRFFSHDLPRAELHPFAWLIPADENREKARVVHGEYKCDLSTKATSADKWVVEEILKPQT